jgi:hypothetical protein
MKRNIWLFLLSPLLVLTGVPAHAGSINLTDMLSAAGTCLTPPDPGTPGLESGLPAGCWTLQNQNSDGSFGGVGQTLANGTGDLLNGLTVIGSDVNTGDGIGIPNDGALFSPDPINGGFDPALLGVDGSGDGLSSPGFDPYGTPYSTFTQFTTVITASNPGLTTQSDGITVAGDLTFTWTFTTLDAGSFYDQAGYIYCPSTSSNPTCQQVPLTMNFDALANGFNGAALNPDGSLNTDPSTFPDPSKGFLETGSVTIAGVSAGDTFGAYVLSLDNTNGAGTIVLAGQPSSLAPEPASFLLIGGGLLALGGAGRKARRRRQEEKTTAV